MSASSDGRLFDPGGLGHDDDVCLTLEDDQLSDMMMMKSIMKVKERNCVQKCTINNIKVN